MGGSGHHAGGGLSKEEQYWLCRRSLRIWPIPGRSDEEMSKNLGVFMRDKLHLSSAFLKAMGQLSIKRVAEGPAAKIQDEVIAVFSTVEIRDTIRRAVKELGGGEGPRNQAGNSILPPIWT